MIVVSPRALFRYFQMNSLANLTVFTLKKGYARNVCDVSQFDTFAYFYAISTFYLPLPRFVDSCKVRALHYANELFVRVRVSFQKLL